MRTWAKRAMVALLLAVACGTTSSGATYTASSTNPQTFGAASDFGLDVEMDSQPAAMRGSRSMSATPTVRDGVAVQSVAIQRAPAGTGTWTTICTDTSAVSGWGCTLDTTTLTDGLYDFRARATNVNGYTRWSSVVADRRIDNTAPAIAQADPGLWFRGTLDMSTTTLDDNGGSGVASVEYEYRLSPLGTWTTACTANSAPFECDFATGGLLDGTGYDFRAIATDVAGNRTTTTAFTNRKPDNLAPSGLLVDPGLNLRLIEQISISSAADLHSGVASVAVQYTAAGAGSWSTACVTTTSPFGSCDWDTTGAPDGLVDLRAIITDVAGNTFTANGLSNLRVDNMSPTASLDAPLATSLSGSITLQGSAGDGTGSGVKEVRFQRSPAGAGAWTTVCTDPSASYSCVWNTATVSDGLYDLRAHATDNADNVGTSTVLADRRIDNNIPSAADVQTADSSGTPDGLIETGDSITLTYSEEIDPASIVAGWNGGGTQNIHVRSTQAGGNGGPGSGDKLLFYNAANSATIPLAGGVGVSLGGDYVTNANPQWAATLTRNASGNAFTVTFGAKLTVGANVNTVAVNTTMQWIPAAGARDMVAKACSTTARNETGLLDREF